MNFNVEKGVKIKEILFKKEKVLTINKLREQKGFEGYLSN